MKHNAGNVYANEKSVNCFLEFCQFVFLELILKGERCWKRMLDREHHQICNGDLKY